MQTIPSHNVHPHLEPDNYQYLALSLPNCDRGGSFVDFSASMYYGLPTISPRASSLVEFAREFESTFDSIRGPNPQDTSLGSAFDAVDRDMGSDVLSPELKDGKLPGW